MRTLLDPGSRTRRHVRRLVATGIHAARHVTSLGRPRPEARVLCYHRIDREAHRSCVTPAAFRDQMRYLRDEGYDIVPLATIAQHLERGTEFRPHTVAVTFDDGFADNYEHAFPVLRALDIPATVFVAVEAVGKRLTVLRDRPSGIPALTWEQIRDMQREHIAVGSHTLTHPRLTELAGDALDRELVGSRDAIASHTGTAPDLFCYPRGDLNAGVRDAVRRAGYRLACATTAGGVTGSTDPFVVPRTFVARDDAIADFARKLDGDFDYLHHGVTLLRRHWPGSAAS
jgi:peptidoglycan/xylan/chitin deacetylase (PgdA/CDA1 family)